MLVRFQVISGEREKDGNEFQDIEERRLKMLVYIWMWEGGKDLKESTEVDFSLGERTARLKGCGDQ